MLKIIGEFDMFLAEKKIYFSGIIIGGAALNIMNITARVTKDVDFIENVHHSADTIFYTKMIDEKVVKERKIVLKEYENWEKYLERK